MRSSDVEDDDNGDNDEARSRGSVPIRHQLQQSSIMMSRLLSYIYMLHCN